MNKKGFFFQESGSFQTCISRTECSIYSDLEKNFLALSSLDLSVQLVYTMTPAGSQPQVGGSARALMMSVKASCPATDASRVSPPTPALANILNYFAKVANNCFNNFANRT